MKIDYISDLHLDFHVKVNSNLIKYKSRTEEFLSTLLPDELGEVLIIAGDLSHYNRQSVWILEYFSKLYERVFWTAGNHDFYLISNKQRKDYVNSKNKVLDLIVDTEHLSNVDALIDYTVCEHKGVTFTGSTNWYPLTTFEERNFFNTYMNDSRLIYGFDIAEASYKESVLYDEMDNVDVIVTHVPPIMIDSHHEYGSTYCYLNQPKEFKAKHWVMGHSHEISEYEKGDCKFYVNALGYPNENVGAKIKSFVV